MNDLLSFQIIEVRKKREDCLTFIICKTLDPFGQISWCFWVIFSILMLLFYSCETIALSTDLNFARISKKCAWSLMQFLNIFLMPRPAPSKIFGAQKIGIVPRKVNLAKLIFWWEKSPMFRGKPLWYQQISSKQIMMQLKFLR